MDPALENRRNGLGHALLRSFVFAQRHSQDIVLTAEPGVLRSVALPSPKRTDATGYVLLEPCGGLLKRIYSFGGDSITAGDPQQDRRAYKRTRTEHYACFLFQNLPCRKDRRKINVSCSSRGSRVRPLRRPFLRPPPKAGRPQA